MKKYFFIALFLVLVTSLYSQNDSVREQSLDDPFESFFENTSDEANQQLATDELEYLSTHPANLRYASYADLIRIPFISPLLAEQIIIMRDTIPLTSIDILRSIPECNDELIDKISPFVTTENSNDYSVFLPEYVRSRTRAKRRLQTVEGFREQKFLGDRNAAYQRLQIGNSTIEIGSIFEKDIAERYSDGFISGYISLQNIGILKKGIIGNYSFTCGQGLLAGRNVSTVKSSDVIGQIQKRTESISPSLSIDESRYYRGASAMLSLFHGTFIVLYSNRNSSASVDSNDAVTSFYSSGLYRTINDLAKKDAASETIFGGVYSVEVLPMLSIGTGFIRIQYDKNISPQVYELQHNKEITAGTVFGNYQIDRMNFFGEIATNNGESYSSLYGAMFRASQKISISYLLRNYSQQYRNPIAKPFSNRDKISDGETGNYIGMKLLPNKNVTISVYSDFYKLPAENGFTGAGAEYFIQARMKMLKNFEVTGHIKSKRKEKVMITGNDDQRIQTNYRIGYKYRLAAGIILSQRLELNNVHYLPSMYKERGTLSFIDVSVRKNGCPLSGKMRFVLFGTDSYDSRVYQYETDVRGGYSNPALFGKGNRWYCLLRYDLSEDFSCSLRYSETKKLHDVVIGSGDDEIAGNLDNQVTLQMDLEL